MRQDRTKKAPGGSQAQKDGTKVCGNYQLQAPGSSGLRLKNMPNPRLNQSSQATLGPIGPSLARDPRVQGAVALRKPSKRPGRSERVAPSSEPVTHPVQGSSSERPGSAYVAAACSRTRSKPSEAFGGALPASVIRTARRGIPSAIGSGHTSRGRVRWHTDADPAPELEKGFVATRENCDGMYPAELN